MAIPFDYESLRLIWWLLMGVLLIGFALTDGFDLGVAALSRRVRAFAEHHLDLAVPARTLRRRLGLASTPSLVLRRLEELGTPPGSRVRARVRDVLGPFPLTLEVSP